MKYIIAAIVFRNPTLFAKAQVRFAHLFFFKFPNYENVLKPPDSCTAAVLEVICLPAVKPEELPRAGLFLPAADLSRDLSPAQNNLQKTGRKQPASSAAQIDHTALPALLKPGHLSLYLPHEFQLCPVLCPVLCPASPFFATSAWVHVWRNNRGGSQVAGQTSIYFTQPVKSFATF